MKGTSYTHIGCACLVAQLCPALCNPMDCSLPGTSVHGGSPGKNTGAGCHTLRQGIFPTQGSNPGLLHCRQILYHLSHQGSPYVYIYPLFFGFPSIEVTTEQSAGNSLVTCFGHSSVYYVNISLPLHPTLGFLHWHLYICFLRLCLYFCFANKIICTILPLMREVIYRRREKLQSDDGCLGPARPNRGAEEMHSDEQRGMSRCAWSHAGARGPGKIRHADPIFI